LKLNVVSCAMPKAGAKFSELMTGGRFVVVGVVGAVGVVGVDDPLLPPPHAARATNMTATEAIGPGFCMTPPIEEDCSYGETVAAYERPWTGLVHVEEKNAKGDNN